MGRTQEPPRTETTHGIPNLGRGFGVTRVARGIDRPAAPLQAGAGRREPRPAHRAGARQRRYSHAQRGAPTCRSCSRACPPACTRLSWSTAARPTGPSPWRGGCALTSDRDADRPRQGQRPTRGFAACTGDIIVMLDADGSADAAEIPRFVAALVDGADFAKGSRFVQGGGSVGHHGVRRFGNRALNPSSTRCTEPTTATSATATTPSGGVSPVHRVDCDGFEVETLMNVRVAQAGLVIHEVPSFERSACTARATSTRCATGSACCAPSASSASPRSQRTRVSTAGLRRFGLVLSSRCALR